MLSLQIINLTWTLTKIIALLQVCWFSGAEIRNLNLSHFAIILSNLLKFRLAQNPKWNKSFESSAACVLRHLQSDQKRLFFTKKCYNVWLLFANLLKVFPPNCWSLGYFPVKFLILAFSGTFWLLLGIQSGNSGHLEVRSKHHFLTSMKCGESMAAARGGVLWTETKYKQVRGGVCVVHPPQAIRKPYIITIMQSDRVWLIGRYKKALFPLLFKS